MTRRAAANSVPAFQKHLHADLEVTREELDAFTAAETSVQLLVIARLRATADDQEGPQLLGLYSMGIAVLAVILTFVPGLVPHVKPITWGAYWWISAVVVVIVFLAIGVIVVLVVAPILMDQLKLNRKRERAVVWLGAYLDELGRLRSASGKAARRWRKTHLL